ncbi:MAG: chemotaxis protein CheX [Pirellulales bacterium]|nr:chemotaxis protein CheX [Pirellulales bacterium]
METTYDTQIEQIVQSIFATMLGMEVVRHPEGDVPCEESLISTIQIAGAQPVTVVFGVSANVARGGAAAMLQIGSDDVTKDDERDVVAELSNMIGGNLKSLLPGPLYLSLPTVVAGKELGVQVPGAELIEEVTMLCESGMFRVRLYEQPVRA